MSLMEILLLVVVAFAAILLLIIGAIWLKRRFCPSNRNIRQATPIQFTMGGDEENEREGFLREASTSLYSPRLGATGTTPNTIEVEVETRSLRTVNSQSSLRHLPSRPSAPILEDARNLERTSSRHQIYASTTSISSPRPLPDIRQYQSELLENGMRFEWSSSLPYNLIIAVDAQPSTFGGYCISIPEKSVEFYSLDVRDLPWRFVDPSANSEYEMKNFHFALMLWAERIREAGKVLIYTGYRAHNYDNFRYGRRAMKLFEHYGVCEGIHMGNNSRPHITWQKDPKSFTIYIQPADDLAFGEVSKFAEFIHSYYDIDYGKFQGTHEIFPASQSHNASAGEEYEHEVTENYHIYIDKVKASMKAWTEPCKKCGYVDDEMASRMSLHRIASQSQSMDNI